MREMTIERCGCTKMVHWTGVDLTNITERDVACESSTMVRGAGQRVIAFTYYAPPTLDPVTNRPRKIERKYLEVGIEVMITM